MLPYEAGSARSETAGDLLRTRDEILAEARQRLLQAQQLARKYYDAHHRDAEFAVGDWVWLCLLHRTAQSLDPRAKRKLGPRYAGPFRVLERFGTLAYRLELLVGSRIHDVFHVSLLKAHKGDPPAEAPALPPHDSGHVLPGHEKVLKAQQGRCAWHVLVQWAGLPTEDATWEKLEEFQQHFPDVQLEDELFEEAGRDVMRSRPSPASAAALLSLRDGAALLSPARNTSTPTTYAPAPGGESRASRIKAEEKEVRKDGNHSSYQEEILLRFSLHVWVLNIRS
uniref:Uncharacterized protein n=2 Tax=Avena sativa TaxID=4498 RepID=A0ACD5VKZ1_AVESA